MNIYALLLCPIHQELCVKKNMITLWLCMNGKQSFDSWVTNRLRINCVNVFIYIYHLSIQTTSTHIFLNFKNQMSLFSWIIISLL